ncbi:hypothetical protein B0H14DRAFT_3503718 [Mycena olivaceomarginata]|nr:hypothetical protein B0H14DRAFT_3503718 [Mycena olivaceomarginata]
MTGDSARRWVFFDTNGLYFPGPRTPSSATGSMLLLISHGASKILRLGPSTDDRLHGVHPHEHAHAPALAHLAPGLEGPARRHPAAHEGREEQRKTPIIDGITLPQFVAMIFFSLLFRSPDSALLRVLIANVASTVANTVCCTPKAGYSALHRRMGRGKDEGHSSFRLPSVESHFARRHIRTSAPSISSDETDAIAPTTATGLRQITNLPVHNPASASTKTLLAATIHPTSSRPQVLRQRTNTKPHRGFNRA